MTPHTPGPWERSAHNFGHEMHGDRFFIKKGIATIAAMNGPCLTYDNAESDALLIAAAPDLLAALKFVTARLVSLIESGDCGAWDANDEAPVQNARAAIAKATIP